MNDTPDTSAAKPTDTHRAASPLRMHGGPIAALVLLAIVVWAMVVKAPTQPIVDAGDANTFGFVGHFVQRNLSLFPVPSLDLEGDDVFYPYGTTSVFMTWGFERDLFFAACSSLLGIGPWLKVYFALSLIIGSVGVYAVTVRDFGRAKALGCAVLASLLNIYAISKFPMHLNMSLTHWLAVSIATDFVIAWRLADGKPWSVRLVLWRVCLLVLVLGHDLAYTASYALVSFCVTAIVIAVALGVRWKRQGTRPTIADLFGDWRGELRQHRAGVVTLALALLITTWLYVPLAGQVAYVSSTMGSADAQATMQSDVFWSASPTRLLLPYLPGLNPADRPGFIPEANDALGAGVVGWTFLILAGVGLWHGRKHIAPIAAMLFLLLLFAAYSEAVPTLKAFPWARYSRIAARVTMAYAPIFAMLALLVDWSRFAVNTRRVAVVVIVLLGITEAGTAWGVHQRGRDAYVPDDQFYAFMTQVRDAPGEAVLEWPFCIADGAGVVTGELGPFYGRQAGLFANTRFHDKKVVGAYFGRLTSDMAQPFRDAGWPAMFAPDSLNQATATGQTRCFSEAEWVFFSEFFARGDFAGLIVYPDLLPPGCADEFVARFGEPTGSCTLPRVGEAFFIPRPASMAGAVDVASARTLRLPDAAVGHGMLARVGDHALRLRRAMQVTSDDAAPLPLPEGPDLTTAASAVKDVASHYGLFDAALPLLAPHDDINDTPATRDLLATTLNDLGIAAGRAGNVNASLDLLRASIAHRDNPQVKQNLSVSLNLAGIRSAQAGRLEDAVTFFEQAVDASPTNAEAVTNRDKANAMLAQRDSAPPLDNNDSDAAP